MFVFISTQQSVIILKGFTWIFLAPFLKGVRIYPVSFKMGVYNEIAQTVVALSPNRKSWLPSLVTFSDFTINIGLHKASTHATFSFPLYVSGKSAVT